MMKTAIPFLAAALLAGCNQTPAENQADQLDAADEQSTPAAAEVLHNEADAIEANQSVEAGAVQNAMAEAGNAQVDNSQ